MDNYNFNQNRKTLFMRITIFTMINVPSPLRPQDLYWDLSPALTPYFVFTSLICGPLAIIFGLLSKGGEMTMDTKGKVAVILGIIGLVLTVLIMLVAFRVVILDEFGGFENFLKYYQINSPSSSDMI